MSAPRLELRAVCKTYSNGEQPVEVLHDISLAAEAGTVTALLGRSGCGKSTLLNLAGAMDFPTAGEVLIDGRATAALSDSELTALRRKRVGFVFQSFQLLPTLSVLENIELPLLLAGAPNTAEAARQRLRWVGLEEKAASMPYQLSGGQMQRVAIARALVHSPDLLMADEPTGNLDTASGDEVLALLREAAGRFGATILIATHSAEAHGEARLMIAEIQFLLCGLLGHLPSRSHILEVGARHGIERRGIQRDRIVLVDDQIRHVIGHVGAVVEALSGDRAHAQLAQRLVQEGPVVGEILDGLPGGSVDGGAIGGAQGGIDVPAGGIPRVRQIAELHVHVVEQVGDEAVGQVGRGFVFGWFVGVFGGGRGATSFIEAACRLLHGEARDILRLALIEELEIFLPEVACGFALAVADHHGHDHQVDARLEQRSEEHTSELQSLR